MRNWFLLLIGLLWVAACSTTSPNRLVYSSGFSFANYDYVVIAKPDAGNTHTSLYGMDVEFANLMSRYNMKVLGQSEYASLSDSNRLRTLFARMAATASDDYITLSVSFDDAVSGRTGASITGSAEGDIFEYGDRSEVFESVSETVIRALKSDKQLQIADDVVRK